jgi:hypothetical protein
MANDLFLIENTTREVIRQANISAAPVKISKRKRH